MQSRVRELGVSIIHYQVDLHEKVFYMAGFKRKRITDDLVDWYFLQIDECTYLDSPDLKRKVELLAINIFEDLQNILSGSLEIAISIDQKMG